MAADYQQIVDQAVLLYALARLKAHGRLKVQKGLFTALYSLRTKGEPGPAYPFFRHHYGPYSQKIWNDCDHMVAMGLLHATVPQPTERGKFIAEIVESALTHRRPNRAAIEDLNERLDWCRKHSADDLKDRVYQMRVTPDGLPGETMRVADIPMKTVILDQPARRFEVSSSDAQVLVEQFCVNVDELAQSQQQAAETDRGAFNRLREALTAAQP